MKKWTTSPAAPLPTTPSTALLAAAATLGLAALLPAPAVAAGAENRLEEVLVSASRVPQPRRAVAASVSVLEEEDIRAMGDMSLVDVVRRMPSVSVSRNGGPGSTSTLRIRGEEGYRTVVLLDGMRIADPAGPQIMPQLEHLLSAGVHRVEMLRGPQGLAYGADAGGVLRISSAPPDEGLRMHAGMEGGSFGTSQQVLGLDAGHGRADIALMGSRYHTRGFNSQVADTDPADRDGYQNETLHARLGFDPDEAWRLSWSGHRVRGESEFDGCVAATTTHHCRSDYDLRAQRLGLAYEDGDARHSLAWSRSETVRENRAQGLPSFSSDGGLERVDYIARLDGFQGFGLVLGADWERAAGNDRERDNYAYFAEYLSDFSSRLHLSAGVRRDHNDDFGTHTSYRLGAAWLQPLAGGASLRLRGSAGTGFRAPSPYEVDYNAGDFAVPPASQVQLREERSRGYETAVEYLDHDLHLQAVWFDQRLDDAIYFDLSTFSGYLQDDGRSRSRGVELSGQWRWSDALRLTANYTLNDTADPEGRQRLRRPRHLGNLGLAYQPAGYLRLNLWYRFARNRVDEAAGERVNLDDYEVFDLRAGFNLTQSLEAYARVENLFDEEYREVAGYRTGGRAGYVGLRWQIN